MRTDTTTSGHDSTDSHERSAWRTVALPAEHGGWGLTLEPVVLGLLIAWSWPGLAIGVAAFLAFLVRTPLKLALVDRRRHRSLPRTRLAERVAAVELLLIAALGVTSLIAAGPTWLVPVAIALPLVAVELWFDIRSRGRRLVPELAGACGIAAVASAIVLADDDRWRLAAAAWLVLAARAMCSIPYVRTQIARVRRGASSLASADAFQLVGVVIAVAAAVLEPQLWLGAAAVVAVAGAQALALRRPTVPPVKIIGVRQMGAGFAVVIAAAIGVLA